MKNVRVWFSKNGTAKYISHLDLNRVILRAIQQSKIPIKRTEGFNPRISITFALPLSLGFSSENESMDMTLLNDIYDKDDIIEKINCGLPAGIKIFDLTEPVMPASSITEADFEVYVKSDKFSTDELYNKFCSFFDSDNIIVEKRTKKGTMKNVDLKVFLNHYQIKYISDRVIINLRLPAGNNININPMLIFNAAENSFNDSLYIDILRKNLYNNKGEIFR